MTKYYKTKTYKYLFRQHTAKKISLNTDGETIPVLPEDKKNFQLRDVKAFQTVYGKID